MSKIEWTGKTWNPVVGCSIVSPGCTNCYAMKMAARLERMLPPGNHYAGLTKKVNGNAVWTGKLALAPEKTLTEPLRVKKPTTWFVNSMGDLFHEDVPDAWIDKVFAVMALCPQHTFQVLTKRSERMREYMLEQWQPAKAWKLNDGFQIPAETKGETRASQVSRECEDFLTKFGLADVERDELWTAEGNCKAMQWNWPLRNVWLGVSTEDQTRADERIPDLLATPAAVHFVSAEPLLGPIDFTKWLNGCFECSTECGWRSGKPPEEESCSHCGWQGDAHDEFCPECSRQVDGYVCPECGDRAVHHHPDTPVLDWIIVGGESGSGARPMHPQWARAIRDQCKAAGVAFFFKQWGEFAPGDGDEMFRFGKRLAGRLLDGIEHNSMPEALT